MSASNARVSWLLLLPMLVIMLVVTGFPAINTLWLAFTDAALTGRGYDGHFVWFENFAYIAGDKKFRAALGATFYFSIDTPEHRRRFYTSTVIFHIAHGRDQTPRVQITKVTHAKENEG